MFIPLHNHSANKSKHFPTKTHEVRFYENCCLSVSLCSIKYGHFFLEISLKTVMQRQLRYIQSIFGARRRCRALLAITMTFNLPFWLAVQVSHDLQRLLDRIHSGTNCCIGSLKKTHTGSQFKNTQGSVYLLFVDDFQMRSSFYLAGLGGFIIKPFYILWIEHHRQIITFLCCFLWDRLQAPLFI